MKKIILFFLLITALTGCGLNQNTNSNKTESNATSSATATGSSTSGAENSKGSSVYHKVKVALYFAQQAKSDLCAVIILLWYPYLQIHVGMAEMGQWYYTRKGRQERRSPHR